MITSPQRVTADAGSNDQLLYFTSSSLTADDSRLVFLSDRSGHPNIFDRNLRTGEERQLSFNAEGSLKSYVYFNGTPYVGLGRASVSLHAESGTVYYLQGREIRKITAEGKETTLAEYPADQMTAFTHVSSDGKLLCVPTVDARALEGSAIGPGVYKPSYDIDQRVQDESLSSYLRVYDTETGREIACEKIFRGWVTHVQFCPTNPALILYNHEWPSDCGVRRVWLWDGKSHRQLRSEGEGRSRNDWACHEMWTRDGKSVIYHGKYAGGPTFVGRVWPNEDRPPVEISLPMGWNRYGHFTMGDDNTLVSDGYYCLDETDTGKTCPWISRLDVDWKAKQITWTPRCRQDSSWDSQDSHPHPIFNHAGDQIYFTSDFEGKRAVYSVPAY